MRRRVALLLAAVLLLQATPAGAASFDVGPATPPLSISPRGAVTRAEFANPPMWARPHAYWLTALEETPEGAAHQIRDFKRIGLGGVTFEPGGLFDSVDLLGPNIPNPVEWPYKYLSP